MNIQFRVLTNDEKDLVLAFERGRESLDPFDQMKNWTAPWRPESLDHYLQQGWSFGAWDGDRLVGYFLAQTILFYRGMTQTLWIEALTGETKEIAAELVQIAVRYGRDKHLQAVLFYKPQGYQGVLQGLKGNYLVSEEVFETRTTRF